MKHFENENLIKTHSLCHWLFVSSLHSLSTCKHQFDATLCLKNKTADKISAILVSLAFAGVTQTF